MVERAPGGVHGSSTPARRARVTARVPSAPASSTTRASPAAMRAAAASSARIGVSPPIGCSRARTRARVESEPLDDQPGEVVVGPRADRHELDRVDLVEQARAGIRLGRARGVEQQRQRFRERDVVVVPPGDLTDADDDRECARHLDARLRSLALTRCPRRAR